MFAGRCTNVAIQKIQTAITNKILDSIDIDNRVKKVLLAKYNLGLATAPVINTNNLFDDLNKDVKPLKRKVAQNALTVLRLKDTALFPLKPGKKSCLRWRWYSRHQHTCNIPCILKPAPMFI